MMDFTDMSTLYVNHVCEKPLALHIVNYSIVTILLASLFGFLYDPVFIMEIYFSFTLQNGDVCEPLFSHFGDY